MALNDQDRAELATLGLCCETWMGFRREALDRGDHARAAACAARAEQASALAFQLAGMRS